MSGEYLLSDIKTRRVPQAILFSPGLAALLQSHGDELVALYRAGVAKRTGRLAASASAHVTIGGHKHDRLIGKVTVGDELEYAALHEFGAKSNPDRRAYRDLAEAVQRWKGVNRAYAVNVKQFN